MSFIHITRKGDARAQEQASGVFSSDGASLPGAPAYEQYLIGNEHNSDQGVPDAFFAGMKSADVGLMRDSMDGLQTAYNDGIVHVQPAIASGGRAQEGIGFNDAFLNSQYGPVDFDSATDE